MTHPVQVRKKAILRTLKGCNFRFRRAFPKLFRSLKSTRSEFSRHVGMPGSYSHESGCRERNTKKPSKTSILRRKSEISIDCQNCLRTRQKLRFENFLFLGPLNKLWKYGGCFFFAPSCSTRHWNSSRPTPQISFSRVTRSWFNWSKQFSGESGRNSRRRWSRKASFLTPGRFRIPENPGIWEKWRRLSI